MTQPAVPKYYSADYRLSKMETFTVRNVKPARVTDWLTLDLAYKRYEMRGVDGVTSQSAYPKANIVHGREPGYGSSMPDSDCGSL